MAAARLCLPAVVLLVGLLTAGVAAAEPVPPELIFDGPPELAGYAERLRRQEAESYLPAMALTGLEVPGPPIRVILAAEGSPLAERVPSWISGYALGELGVVVLLVERVPSYPDGSLEEVLRHEVCHVLVDRAARGRAVPRWLHEGTAMLASGQWGLRDRTYLAIALVRARQLSLDGLERYFQHDADSAARAYALSAAFVRDLESRYGSGTVARLLAALAQGQSLDDAFLSATGNTLAAAEAEFWGRETFWSRWLPWITSSAVIWLGITLLALYAIKRRRSRDAELRRHWLAEEQRQEAERARLLGQVLAEWPEEDEEVN